MNTKIDRNICRDPMSVLFTAELALPEACGDKQRVRHRRTACRVIEDAPDAPARVFMIFDFRRKPFQIFVGISRVINNRRAMQPDIDRIHIKHPTRLFYNGRIGADASDSEISQHADRRRGKPRGMPWFANDIGCGRRTKLVEEPSRHRRMVLQTRWELDQQTAELISEMAGRIEKSLQFVVDIMKPEIMRNRSR